MHAVEFERIRSNSIPLGFIGRYLSKPINTPAVAFAFFSQEKQWNRPDVLHSSWPLYFRCTVAALKIVLARGSYFSLSAVYFGYGFWRYRSSSASFPQAFGGIQLAVQL